MNPPATASFIDVVLGLATAPAGQDPGNRFSLEGLTLRPGSDGTLEFGIEKIEAASLRVSSGPLMLELGHFALHKLVAVVRSDGGKPRLSALDANSAEFSGVKVHGPLVIPRVASGGSAAGQGADTSWRLVPLAAAEGTIRAEIVDAHLLFDADVTVPIRQGRIDLDDATVEHVGPDSRMGASRLGLYVDAPNGRSYLYQFPSAPVVGVQYERRGALLGPFVTDRGHLRLQEFGEWLLRQHPSEEALGFTEQARLLLARTAVSGHVQLGDGSFVAPGLQADLAGRADGRNVLRLHSEAVGRGLTLEMASLSIRNAILNWGGTQMGCDEMAGALTLRLFLDGAQLRFALDLADMKITGLSLRSQRPAAT